MSASDGVGRDTRYTPLMGAVSDSFHGAAEMFDNQDDDDDSAPPASMLPMGDMGSRRKFRGFKGLSLAGRTGSGGLIWPSSRDLDKFLTRIYRYYVGKGLSTIILAKLFNLLILGFIVGFTTFLAGCVDYSILFSTYDFYAAVNISKLAETNPFIVICLVVFILYWVWHVLHVILSIRGLLGDHAFYTDILGIPDSDLATTRWTDVVTRLLEVQPEDNLARRLNHHDVANIIMRRDNYLIALFNQGVISLSIPIYGNWKTPQFLTKSLEWNLDRLMDFIFDDNTLRKQFTLQTSQEELARSLKWRMYFWAFVNLLFSPFIAILLVMYFVFQYGEEVHRDPGSLGARQYTPYARMIFREFNEYPHLFERRLNASYEKARDYMRLFPYENFSLLARFVAFVSGAFAVVLLLLSFLDENVLLKMEIVPGHNVLWFLGVFSAIYAAARSFIPAETLVFQPEKLMRAVIEGTHYYPPHWHQKLHTDLIRRQFSRLFQYKVVAFLVEIVGVIFVPLVLFIALPACADDIVSFVFENTKHQEKVGDVCSFALFDMQRHGNPQYGAPASTATNVPKTVSRFGKMEKSFLNFKANNPTWQPGPDGAAYLDNLSRYQNQANRATVATPLTAHDLAESSLFLSSVVLSGTRSAPDRSTIAATVDKGKTKAVHTSEHVPATEISSQVHVSQTGQPMSVSDVGDSFMSMNASTLDNQGMMSLLESVYDAQESGMV